MPASTTIGKLLIELLLEDEDFQRGMKGAEGTTKKKTAAMGSAMTKVSKVVTGAFKAMTAAAIAFGVATTKVGSDFEQAMATLGAIAGEAQGTKGFKALEDQARLLGATTLFTATQAAEGMLELKKAGLEVKDVIEASNATLIFAGATNQSLAEASQTVAATMKQFGLEADQATRITDVFSKAMRDSLLDANSLKEAMKFAGTAGSAFGNSLEQTTAAVAAFRDLGLEGSLAGTQLRMALQFAAKGSDKAAAALDRYGLKLEDINPEQKSIVEILNQVAAAGVGATDAMTIFGARAGASVFAVAKNIRAGRTDLVQFTKDLENSTGETAEIYEIMLQNAIKPDPDSDQCT